MPSERLRLVYLMLPSTNPKIYHLALEYHHAQTVVIFDLHNMWIDDERPGDSQARMKKMGRLSRSISYSNSSHIGKTTCPSAYAAFAQRMRALCCLCRSSFYDGPRLLNISPLTRVFNRYRGKQRIVSRNRFSVETKGRFDEAKQREKDRLSTPLLFGFLPSQIFQLG